MEEVLTEDFIGACRHETCLEDLHNEGEVYYVDF